MAMRRRAKLARPTKDDPKSQTAAGSGTTETETVAV